MAAQLRGRTWRQSALATLTLAPTFPPHAFEIYIVLMSNCLKFVRRGCNVCPDVAERTPCREEFIRRAYQVSISQHRACVAPIIVVSAAVLTHSNSP